MGDRNVNCSDYYGLKLVFNERKKTGLQWKYMGISHPDGVDTGDWWPLGFLWWKNRCYQNKKETCAYHRDKKGNGCGLCTSIQDKGVHLKLGTASWSPGTGFWPKVLGSTHYRQTRCLHLASVTAMSQQVICPFGEVPSAPCFPLPFKLILSPLFTVNFFNEQPIRNRKIDMMIK